MEAASLHAWQRPLGKSLESSVPSPRHIRTQWKGVKGRPGRASITQANGEMLQMPVCLAGHCDASGQHER